MVRLRLKKARKEVWERSWRIELRRRGAIAVCLKRKAVDGAAHLGARGGLVDELCNQQSKRVLDVEEAKLLY